MTSILTIGGSPSTPSRTSAFLEYCTNFLTARDCSVENLNIRDLDPAEVLHGQFNGATVQPALAQVAAAQGVIIATPVYKAAYTGVLKAFLDLLPQGALANKAVLPFALGGSPAHSLMLDYAFKPVLAALSAYTILSGVYIIDSQVEHQDGHDLRFTAPDAEARVQEELQTLINAVKSTK